MADAEGASQGAAASAAAVSLAPTGVAASPPVAAALLSVLQAVAGQEYCFDLGYQDTSGPRHVRYYKAPIARSTALLNLRLMPVPKEAATLPPGPYVFVARPQGYFSRDRDPVEINGAVSKDEPNGLPLADSFVAAVPGDAVTVRLRGERLAMRPSGDLAKDLPVADFLW